MSTINANPAMGVPDWQAERETLTKRIADLEARLEEVTRQRDDAKSDLYQYEQMYHFWNVYGIAPPRECELEEARKNGITMEKIIGEIDERFGSSSGGA